ncbi:MAG: hypothetical protein E6J18_14940, partial [Chloroflexi bacterium]
MPPRRGHVAISAPDIDSTLCGGPASENEPGCRLAPTVPEASGTNTPSRPSSPRGSVKTVLTGLRPEPARVTPNRHVAFVDLRAQTGALQPALIAAIETVLSRGDFILGDDLERFEAEFAAFCGTGHAVG